jgi:putative FmdB family regulatory protein
MPTYEYRCKSCDEVFETIQSIKAEASAECPKCHNITTIRLISGGSFVLKGGGWAADNYSSTKTGS